MNNLQEWRLQTTSSSTRMKTPISLLLKLWLGVEVLFGIAAIGAVFIHPEKTASNFAWTIKPTVMAATFGAFYLSVGLLFILGVLARWWQQVRAITVPAAVFTAFMLLTTFIHWNKFAVSSPPFYVWFASYLLPPPIFTALYFQHQKRADPIAYNKVQKLVRPLRIFLLINGLLLASIALLFYVFPGLLVAIAPWKFTPLTVRTLCGWFIGVGLLEICLAREGDWQRVKIGTTMLAILPFALVFQLLRFRQEVQWNNLSLWIVLIDFSIVSLLCIGIWFVYPKKIVPNLKD
jgi:hypothetical protein